jgi:hypothetical protein
VAAFVTGIAPTQNVNELETLLSGMSGLDRSKFVVITKASREEDDYDDSFINFTHVGGDDHQLEGDGSSHVPGINPSTPGLGYLGHRNVVQHVGTLPIPDDEADNYNDAIDDGRSVVAYPAEGDAATIDAAFKTAGLKHVKIFR